MRLRGANVTADNNRGQIRWREEQNRTPLQDDRAMPDSANQPESYLSWIFSSGIKYDYEVALARILIPGDRNRFPERQGTHNPASKLHVAVRKLRDLDSVSPVVDAVSTYWRR